MLLVCRIWVSHGTWLASLGSESDYSSAAGGPGTDSIFAEHSLNDSASASGLLD